MLSRIADSLFWMSRYLERTETLLRLVRTQYILSFDADADDKGPGWPDFVETFTSKPTHDTSDPALVLDLFISNIKNINSVKVIVTKARENARGVQDNITKEVWENINQLYLLVQDPNLSKNLGSSLTLDTLEKLVGSLVLNYGVIENTMPRGLGWSFMNLGKYIERTTLTIQILRLFFEKQAREQELATDFLYWRKLLLSLSGYEMYLRNFTGTQYLKNIVDHTICNSHFPRSLNYSIERAKRSLDQIVLETPVAGAGSIQNQFGRLYSQIQYLSLIHI